MIDEENFKNTVNKLKELIQESNTILENGWFDLTIEQKNRLSVLNNEITKIRRAK